VSHQIPRNAQKAFGDTVAGENGEVAGVMFQSTIEGLIERGTRVLNLKNAHFTPEQNPMETAVKAIWDPSTGPTGFRIPDRCRSLSEETDQRGTEPVSSGVHTGWWSHLANAKTCFASFPRLTKEESDLNVAERKLEQSAYQVVENVAGNQNAFSGTRECSQNIRYILASHGIQPVHRLV